MTVCLVTDRRRVADGVRFADACDRLVEQVRAAVEAGVDLVQVRERDLEARQLMTLVTAVVRASRQTNTRVVVNDRLDVALGCGADGVHLRGDSLSAAAVRRLAPAAFLVGRSVHSVEEARAAGPVDYLIAGPVFATVSKPEGHPTLGLAGLGAIARAANAPVLAIGGVTVDRAGSVAGSGAAGIAAIGLFAAGDPLTSLVRELRLRFDSVRSAS